MTALLDSDLKGNRWLEVKTPCRVQGLLYAASDVWEVLFKFLLAVFSDTRPLFSCAGALNDLLGRSAVAGPEGSMRSV